MSTGNAVAVRHEGTITELPLRDPGALMEGVITKGDLSQLQPEERARYYVELCRSMGMNPLTRPFQYIDFGAQGGGLQLYARKEAADQLRGIHKVQTRIVETKIDQGIYVVVIEARHPDGRVETDIGAVAIDKLAGPFLANAMKKAITQGKRRATLAMLGLSLLDEDDLKGIPNARVVRVDVESGEVLGHESRAVTTDPGLALNRNQEAKDLINAIIATYMIDPEGAKQIGEDLICLRWGLDKTADATAEQLRQTREAVASWRDGDPNTMLAHLRMIGSVETATMARDVETVLGQQNVNDPFVLGALIDRLDALELEERRTQTRIAKTIDAVATPS